MTRQELLAATHRMADATGGWMPAHQGLELARNVAQSVQGGDDPYQAAVAGIQHRIACGWLHCQLVHDLAQHMAAAWRGNQ
jgi:hypothetical protein